MHASVPFPATFFPSTLKISFFVFIASGVPVASIILSFFLLFHEKKKPKKTGRAEMATTLRLEKCDLRHTCEARTFYIPPLERKGHKKIKGGHSG